MKTAEIIEKWYKKLNFNSKFDDEFYDALQTIGIPAETSIADYDLDCTDGKKNLLSFLYMCEELEKQYAERGISEDILLDTLSDIVRWCVEWSEIKGELYLGEIGWVSRSMKFNLFKIGRLQYCILNVPENLAAFGMKVGECYIDIHIPRAGPLEIEEVKSSLNMAREFFDEYFPELQYSYFSCLSWLLDDTLQELLPPGSNILKFARLFTVVDKAPSDSILNFIFRIGTTREDIEDRECRSSFAHKVKNEVRNGRIFYQARGLIAK